MKVTKKDTIYVVTQLILFAVYIFIKLPKIDFQIPLWLQVLGALSATAGVVMVVLSFIALNKSLSPFPSPKEKATLITNGIYSTVRHPIYSGILWMALGYGLYTEDTLRLLVFVALLILFINKAKYEEQLLMKKFPDYIFYKFRTFGFLPAFE